MSEELAWAAGFFDGEGSTIRGVKDPNRWTPKITIWQVALEPLERFKDAVGVGRINGPYQRGVNKPIYQYGTSGINNCWQVISLIDPWLSEFKRYQAVDVLSSYYLQPPALHRVVCLHGHPFDEANTYYRPGTNTRICRTCVRLRMREHRARMAVRR